MSVGWGQGKKQKKKHTSCTCTHLIPNVLCHQTHSNNQQTPESVWTLFAAEMAGNKIMFKMSGAVGVFQRSDSELSCKDSRLDPQWQQEDKLVSRHLICDVAFV